MRLHMLAANTSDYASSPSGYVISVLMVVIIAMIGYLVRVNDKRHSENSQKLDNLSGNYATLDKTVAVLSETVSVLKQTVDKLPDIPKGS